MKIAVISDIHGNMEAIEAVMEDIEQQGCEKLFVLGDYAMAGPEPAEAVKYFMKRQDDPNVVMIQGNTDSMIVDYSFDLYDELKEKAPIMAEALKSDAKLLNDSQKEFLKMLPAQNEVEICGVKFLLVHGSPRQNNENIFPNLKIEEVEEMVEGVDADVILCGHTHIPCGYQTNTKKTVVNVGSVGRPFTNNPQCCYLIANVHNGVIEFVHRLINYDKETAAKILAGRNFEGAEKLSQILIDPQERHM